MDERQRTRIVKPREALEGYFQSGKGEEGARKKLDSSHWYPIKR